MASILTSTRCWGRRTLPILTLLFIVVFQSKAETTDVLTPATVEPSSTSTPNHKYTIKTINSGSYWGQNEMDRNNVITNYKPMGNYYPYIVNGYNHFQATKDQAWEVITPVDWEHYKLVVTIDLEGVYERDGKKNSCILGLSVPGKSFGNNDDNGNNAISYSLNKDSIVVVAPSIDHPQMSLGHHLWRNGTSKYAEFVMDKWNGFSLNGKVIHTATYFINMFSHNSVRIGCNKDACSGNYTIEFRPTDYGYNDNVETSNKILDDANNYFYSAEGVDLVAGRTLKPGIWNTFCVPFDVSEAQLKEVFGADVQLRAYGSSDGNVVYFKEVTSINAGEPYLVKVSKAITDPEFKNVNLVEGAPQLMGEPGECQMSGTYSLTRLATDGSQLFLKDNNFYMPLESDASIKGLRAYFVVPKATNPTALRVNIEGETTSINDIEDAIVIAATPVYNLHGQCVGNSLKGLAPGVYIQNGKKHVVK